MRALEIKREGQSALGELLETQRYRYLKIPFERYISNLVTHGGVSEQVVSAISQGLQTYLAILDENNQSHMAQFLVPGRVNIDQYDPIEVATHRQFWGRNHHAENRAHVRQLLKKTGVPGAEGITEAHLGPMYSGKSEFLVTLAQELTQRNIPFFALTSQAMHENTIHSRVKIDGRESSDIVARQVAFRRMYSRLAAISRVAEPGNFVLIDEATFIPFSDNECFRTFEIFTLLNLKRINVIISGLDKNARAQNLPFTDYMIEHEVPLVMHRSFNAYIVVPHTTIIQDNATYTGRLHDGFFDWILPVVIPRTAMNRKGKPVVKYFSASFWGHPMAVLRRFAPEIAENLDYICNEWTGNCPFVPNR